MEGRNAVWYAEMKTACCLLCFMGFLFKLQTRCVYNGTAGLYNKPVLFMFSGSQVWLRLKGEY